MQAQQQGSGRPADITSADEARIRLVASRVAHSVMPAKFQAELIDRTRNNHYFLFMDPSHRWYGHYQYYVRHFTALTEEQWQQHLREEGEQARQRQVRALESTASTSTLFFHHQRGKG